MIASRVIQWLLPSLFAVLFLILCLIFKSEPEKRRQRRIKNGNHYNFYDKMLDIWSSIFIFLVIINALLWMLAKLSVLCLFTMVSASILQSNMKILLTCYQITRLQYCFSMQQIHSKKYGYSIYIFIILYIIGLLISCSFIILIIQMNYFIHDSYGCFNSWKGPKQIQYLNYIQYTYYAWDLTVLFLYIYKVIQVHIFTNFNDDLIYKRIRFILKKIIFLTILYEIGTLFYLLTTNYVDGEIMVLLIHLNCWMDILLCSWIMYLMIEHNNHHYLRFIRIISCGCFGDNLRDNMNATINDNGNKQDTVVETGTIMTEIHEIQCIEESEETNTFN